MERTTSRHLVQFNVQSVAFLLFCGTAIVVYQWYTATGMSESDFSTSLKGLTCVTNERSSFDLSGVTNRIIGGSPAPSVLAKSFARLKLSFKKKRKLWFGYKSGFSLCVGSILDNRRVLTAAHCLVNFEGYKLQVEQVRVEYGSRFYRSGNIAYASRAFIHKAFDLRTIWHDIAVIELDRAMTPGKYTKVLFTDSVRQGVRLFSMGFEYIGVNEDPSRLLMMSNFTSDGRVNLSSDSDSTMIRARGLGLACQGDSGGPLFKIYCEESGCDRSLIPNRVYQAGIVSHREASAGHSTFMYYTHLPNYFGAIRDLQRGYYSDWYVLNA